tara:strand:+ start:196 stop:867 length:672 start_codon:yes stop_codon:yes gene_type:complete
MAYNWPSSHKAGTTSTDAATDRIDLARADIQQNIVNVNEIIDMFDLASEPSNEQILKYNTTTDRFEVGSAAVGSAAGSDTQIQFNNSGSFGADANFTLEDSASASDRILISRGHLLVGNSATAGDNSLNSSSSGHIQIHQKQGTSPDSKLRLRAYSGGSSAAYISSDQPLVISGGDISASAGATIRLDESSGTLVMTISGLPTSDPGVTGRIWNDGGTLKIST